MLAGVPPTWAAARALFAPENEHMVVWSHPVAVPAEPVKYHCPVLTALMKGLHLLVTGAGSGTHTIVV